MSIGVVDVSAKRFVCQCQSGQVPIGSLWVAEIETSHHNPTK